MIQKINIRAILVLVFVSFIHQLKAQETETDTLKTKVDKLIEDVLKIKRLEISGYLQPQWQYIDSAGAPSFAGGDFVSTDGKNKYYSCFTMRRGRIKFTYTWKNVMFMLNTDWTEKGVAMRETYIKITDPWINVFSLTAGLLQDQFGFEVTQSSSVRETPERARYNQLLFPTERDLGAFLMVQLPKTSPLTGLKFVGAVMNGSSGVSAEFDSHKDFSARLSYNRTSKNEKLTYGIGASYYYGGYTIGSVKDYNFTTLSNGDRGFDFAKDTADYTRVARRIYMGADAQVSVDWKPGITTIRAEYIQGEQPGTSKSSKSPNALPSSSVYHRNFRGAYVYFIQNIGKSKFQVVAKYDLYDPDVKIAGKEIGKTGTNTNAGDIRFDTYGFGLNYYMNQYLKIMAYYDLVKNESTTVPGYEKDIKDNVFTIRMQFKF